MIFIFQRGKKRRVMHLQRYSLTGPVMRALCPIQHPFDATINLPMGRRVCRRCIAIANRVNA